MSYHPINHNSQLASHFPSYPDYKDSGVEWLGDIPAHWETARIIRYAELKTGGTPNRENREYWEDGTINWMASGEVNKKRVFEVDKKITPLGLANSNATILPIHSVMIALNGQGKTKGTAAILEVETSCNQSLAAFICRENKLHYNFLFYYLESKYKQIRGLVGDSLRDGLSLGHLKIIYTPIPPLLEQRAIAAFLDRETAKLDTLMAKKRRLIELLQEKRAALISQAVTKGLNPDVPMKDSGVEWLGEIPAHWASKKFKYCASIRNGQVDPRKEEYRQKILIAPNHIESGTGRVLNTETAEEQGADSGKYVFQEGDILYSKIRPELQKVCIANGNGLCSADMYPVKTFSDVLPRFLLYVMLSDNFTKFTIEKSMRVAMPKINRDDLNNECYVALPPLVTEQLEIVTHLDQETTKIDALIAKTKETIEKLQEYRAALISAAVTGKIDAREERKNHGDTEGTEKNEEPPCSPCL